VGDELYKKVLEVVDGIETLLKYLV